jgi:hypothetical protein
MSSQSSLAVDRSVAPGESGMSFLLRLAHANALSLQALRRLAGISTSRVLTSADAPVLALRLGLEVSVLRDILVSREPKRSRWATRIGNHLFLQPGLLRTKHPQVCIKCVHRSGHCSAVWDCALYSVCHLHQETMTDFCLACRRRLTWDRPSVDICGCGGYLKRVADPLPPPLASFRLSSWLAENFYCAESSPPIQGWASWMGGISLPLLCVAVHAFGACCAPHQRVLSSSILRSRRTADWDSVVARGVARLDALFDCSASIDELKHQVWQAGLESMVARALTTRDRQVSQRLLAMVFGPAAVAQHGIHSAALRQLSLFDL